MGRRTIKRGSGKQWVEGKHFRLANEVRYIQNKAADHDSRVVAIGQLVLFSAETGDAWLLDVTDPLAAPLARDGDPEPIHPEEIDTSFAIGWKGHYRIDGLPSSTLILTRVASERSSDTPPRRSCKRVNSKISNIFG